MYRSLHSQSTRLQEETAAAESLLTKARNEADLLREKQAELHASLEKETSEAADDLSKKLSAAQQDLVRIRSERDSRLADLQEAKAKEAEKMRHAEQMRVLADSRQDRINALASEIHRLRMKLAADDGKAGLVQLISSTASSGTAGRSDSKSASLPEEAVVDHLQQKLKEQDQLLKTFRERLEKLSGADNQEDLDMAEHLVKSEAKACLALEQAKQRLGKLETLLGSDGRDLDGGKLARKIEEDEQTIKRLEANVKASELSMQMLITEVTRLSEAWEHLNTQNHSKILELAQYDARLERAAAEKSKSTQKYFASEREKEALNNQVNVYNRLTQTQKAALEKLEEVRRALHGKLANAEKEIAENEKAVKVHQDKIGSLGQEKSRLEHQNGSLQKQTAEVSI